MKSLTLLNPLTYLPAAVAALMLGGLALQAKADPTFNGSLEVFSSTHEVLWGDGTTYYPHTGYRLIAANGAVTWVENQISVTSTEPEQVELAPGTYTIWAQSDKNGFVKKAVTIKAGQAAELHL